MFGDKSVCLLALVFSIPSAVDASVLISESFVYEDGPLVAVSNGRWKSHSGTPEQIEVLSGCIQLSQRNSEDVSAIFSSGPMGPTNAVALYARFKINFSTLPSGANGTYFAHFKDGSATTGLRCRIFASTNGAPAGMYRLGIAAGAAAASAIWPQDLTLNSEYTVVCRMLLSDNLSSLWLNPSTESEAGITSTDSAPVKTAVAFAFRESLAGGGGMGDLSVDDLIVATTFGEATARAEFGELALNISCDRIMGIKLLWPAQLDRTYSVWAKVELLEGWSLIGTDLWYADGAGEFEEAWSGASGRYYRISSP